MTLVIFPIEMCTLFLDLDFLFFFHSSFSSLALFLPRIQYACLPDHVSPVQVFLCINLSSSESPSRLHVCFFHLVYVLPRLMCLGT